MLDPDSSLPRSNPYSALRITNVRLPFREQARSDSLWTIDCQEGRVFSIAPFNEVIHTAAETSAPKSTPPDAENPSCGHGALALDGQGGLLLPSDFTEAMAVTNRAKAGFSGDLTDLYNRGARIIRESVSYGVTSVRAHVEVDTAVRFSCLETALRLREDFQSICDIQVSVFAQEALYCSPEHENPGENYPLLQEAVRYPGVDVIGSAPYVEPSIEQAKRNISLVFDLADAQGLSHVDFHLDYNLDPTSQPLIYEVISQAKARYSSVGPLHGHAFPSPTGRQTPRVREMSCPRITIGHATRLALFSAEEWSNLVELIGALPIFFVGLPQSDIYMQGRSLTRQPLGAPRGTLNVPLLAKEHQLNVATSANNVQNAFTPQGTLDPLTLCTFGVAIFQCITSQDTHVLLQSISTSSKQAIGTLHRPTGSDESEKEILELAPRVGDNADFVILHGPKTVQAAVVDPAVQRTTVKAGKIVAKAERHIWLAA